MGRLLSQFRLLSAGALCSVMVASLSCQKKTDNEPAPSPASAGSAVSSQEIRAAQEALSHSRQADKLAQKWSAKTTLNWFPVWDASFKIQGNLYVPLRFKVAGQEDTKAMIGAKKFLVLSGGVNNAIPRVATYVFDKPAEAQYLDDAPATLTTFSGVYMLRNLASETSSYGRYRKGTRVRVATSKASATAKTSAVNTCELYYTCSWQADCSRDPAGGGAPYTNYTTTVSAGGCQDPVQQACEENWAKTWTQVGTPDVAEHCDGEGDDTPLPPPATYPASGLYIIRSLAMKAFTVETASTSNGAYVYQTDFTGAGNQKWYVQEVPTSQVPHAIPSWHYYTITALHSGKALFAIWGDSGTPLTQWQPDGTPNQLWALLPNDGVVALGGMYPFRLETAIQNSSNLITLNGGTADWQANGTALSLRGSAGYAPAPNYFDYQNQSQSFYFEPTTP